MRRAIRGVPIWIISIILVCLISVAIAAYIFATIKFPVKVEEPLSVVAFPELLSLYPNTTEYFNITVSNVASVNYLVSLAFSLNDSAYQQAYVTFLDETYTVVPGLSNVTAWIYVSADAPAAQLELTVELSRVSTIQPTFGYMFTWTNETQNLVNGTLAMKIDVRLTEDNLLIVVNINQTGVSLDSWLGFIIDSEFDGFHRGDQGFLFNSANKYYEPRFTELCWDGCLHQNVFLDPTTSPYHNCTYDSAEGFTYYIKLPKTVVPEKKRCTQALRMHIDFQSFSWRRDQPPQYGYEGYDHKAFVSVEFYFENYPFGVPP